MAAKGGEGLYGKTDDKVITNFGFGLIIFFTLLVIGLSVAQYLLEKRKTAQVAASRAVRLQPREPPRASRPRTSPGSRRAPRSSGRTRSTSAAATAAALPSTPASAGGPTRASPRARSGSGCPGQGFLLSFARTGSGDEPRSPPGRVAFDCPLPLVAVGAALRGRRAPVRARGAHRHRPRRLPHGRRAGHPALHRLGRAAVVRVGPHRRASRADHYEQPGSLAGMLEVDGRRHPLAGRGMRDHSWGVRDWQRVPWWRWFGMVVDPDNFVCSTTSGCAEAARRRAAS